MKILNDFSTSVRKALEEIDPKYESYDGLVVCGTHSPHDVEEMIEEIRKVRESGTPFLGICFGHQLAAIEYARNVLGRFTATSEEFGAKPRVYQERISDGFWETKSTGPEFLVRKIPTGLKVGLHDGETYWNNYEVVPGFEDLWQKASNFITCQYHPEYQSSKDKPHPLLVQFINSCKQK